MDDTKARSGTVERKIVLYGAGKSSFSEPEEIRRYIAQGIFAHDRGRFDYPQDKDADVIVFSLGGEAYGHFDIEDKVKPNAKEERLGAKAIYLVTKSTSYENPVPLSPFGIKGIQFGKRLSEEQFRQIKALAGKLTTAVMPAHPLGASPTA